MWIIFPILSVFCTLALWGILGRPRFLNRQNENTADRNARISVIIPARDEKENLARLLPSLTSQKNYPHEIIVVDDQSRDNTAHIASEQGARVIHTAPLPDGWKGKPWACQQGAASATGDWFLFLDADTQLSPEAISSLLPLTRDWDQAHSVLPYHHIQSPYEELSAFFNVIMAAGAAAFCWPDRPDAPCRLFGQSLLISRQAYETIGGHEKVKGQILENFHLAPYLQAAGVRCRSYLGRGQLSMRMFPNGFTDLCDSWKKGFLSGATNVPPRVLILTSLWLTGGMIALLNPSFGLAFPSLTFALASVIAHLFFAASCFYAFRLVGNFSVLNALFFPVSLLFYQGLLFVSWIEKKRGKTTRWKGRDVA